MIATDDWLDALEDLYDKAKRENPGSWFYNEETDSLKSLTMDGDQVTVVHGIGEGLGLLMSMVDVMVPDLIRRIQEVNEELDDLDTERDYLISEVMQLQEELNEALESGAGSEG